MAELKPGYKKNFLKVHCAIARLEYSLKTDGDVLLQILEIETAIRGLTNIRTWLKAKEDARGD